MGFAIAMFYFTDVGPRALPLLHRNGYFAIRVLGRPDDRTPIGEALAAGKDQNGLALWRLTIDELDMPGLWVVIDRRFRPTE